MAQAKRNISRTLLIGATISVAFVIIVLGASNFFATGGLNWSLYPILSVLLGYFTLVPTLGWGKRGVIPSMIVLSVLFVPFIYLMCLLTDTLDTVFPAAVAFSSIGVVYLWIIVLSFWFVGRRPRIALGIILIMGAGVIYCAALALQYTLPAYAQHIQGWQFLGVMICVPIGAAIIAFDYVRHVQAIRREVDAAEKKAARKAARKAAHTGKPKS